MVENVKVYRANQRYDDGYLRTCLVMIQNFIQYRELVWQLYRRDLLANYKKSFIGVAWIVLTPLVGIISWVFMHQTGLLRPGVQSIPYPAYLLMGASMWGLFMGCYKSSSQTLTAARSLVMQASFPREVFLFEKLLLQLTNFAVALLLNLLVILFFRVIPSWGILLFPLVALPMILLAAAIGLFVSLLSIVAENFTKVFHTFIGLTFWITPILYSGKLNQSWAQSMVQWNPLTYLVCSARDMILYGRLYDSTGYWICAVLSVILFVFSWRAFYISEPKILERMI